MSISRLELRIEIETSGISNEYEYYAVDFIMGSLIGYYMHQFIRSLSSASHQTRLMMIITMRDSLRQLLIPLLRIPAPLHTVLSWGNKNIYPSNKARTTSHKICDRISKSDYYAHLISSFMCFAVLNSLLRKPIQSRTQFKSQSQSLKTVMRWDWCRCIGFQAIQVRTICHIHTHLALCIGDVTRIRIKVKFAVKIYLTSP